MSISFARELLGSCKFQVNAGKSCGSLRLESSTIEETGKTSYPDDVPRDPIRTITGISLFLIDDQDTMSISLAHLFPAARSRMLAVVPFSGLLSYSSLPP